METKKAIKQSSLFFLLMVTSIILIILCAASFSLVMESKRQVDKAALTRYELATNAHRFLDASSYLTNEARAYAATGDIAHYNNYWNEIDVAKNRDIAIGNMREFGLTYHESALVTEMFALSINLIPLEDEAMALAASGDSAGALKMVYGWSYEDWIGRIRTAQTKFIKMINERTESELTSELALSQRWIVINTICLAFMALIQVVVVIEIRRRLIRPLLVVRDEMLRLEKGDLHTVFEAIPDTSEMGMLIGSMQATKAGLNTYIREISETLAAIAAEDSTARIDTAYPGDFMEIKHAINEISQILAAQRKQDEHSRKELLAAYEEARAANSAKSNFLSTMSHEIRTPMNAILGMTSIALSSEDPVKRDHCLLKIKDASNHLLGVINDILDMSKIDSGKFELSFSEFNIEKMLLRVVNIINFRVDERRQIFDMHIDPALPISLICDEQRLTQVLTNLLSNAIKFTPEEGEIHVDIRLLREDDEGCRIFVSVTDSGIGISPEQQAKLFQSFQQADAGISRRFGGTGLGLAISKNIIEKMNGRIWVESEEGKGAKFSFEFTAARGTLPEEPRPLLKGINWEDLRLLVADDDPAVCEYFSSVAARLNFHCDVATSGISAFQKATANRYDILFIDWRMPDLDGIALSKKLMEQGTRNDSIIIISSAEWSEIEQEACKIGVSKFIPKPLFTSVIINTIADCVGTEMPVEDPQKIELPDFSRYHILLAEDNEINREIVIALLEPTGITITAAENGLIALHLFAENPTQYDMIFMDMHMPEMDGLTATSNIRALTHPRAKEIPIIAMTANVFREDIERCLAVGMNWHIGKPLDFLEVLDNMKKFLEDEA